jgi:hypothetical protein
MKQWVTPDAWQAYFENEQFVITSLDENVMFIMTRLAGAIAAYHGEPSIEDQLVGMVRAYMFRIIGPLRGHPTEG